MRATFTKTKPIGTIYSDYTIQDGEVYFIFEKNDGRVETIKVGVTNKTNADWREFEVIETESEYKIIL
jgi:hypothetical protein